ncbi:hypothetical protein [Spirosoma foliorum]|uniref:Uncharacterized protein n=1 Tax=Spirosoma foliorum TaxID=2710596 RepID=A0A7G5H2T8_9BACT|nr:hypothetical protein [Spirosoma foliorum]QMW05430.1 hypothetical protein H3H32_11320 [Spirosoma foliorum]
MNKKNISGIYLYRSLINNKVLQTEFNELEFGRGIMTISDADGTIKGTFNMGEGYEMTLKGTIFSEDKNSFLRMTGNGIPGTATDKWVYDYVGLIDPIWPNAVAQTPTITGSVIRSVDHGSSKAGVTATFYMVLTT